MSFVFAVHCQALRNLASLRDEAWATEVGAVFLGPLLAVMRLIDDDAAVQQAGGMWGSSRTAFAPFACLIKPLLLYLGSMLLCRRMLGSAVSKQRQPQRRVRARGSRNPGRKHAQAHVRRACRHCATTSSHNAVIVDAGAP